LCDATWLVQYFMAEQLESFLTRRSRTGLLITPAHLRVIMKEASEGARQYLVEYFYSRSCTPQTLGAEAARMRGPRPTVVPRFCSLGGAVHNVEVMSKALFSRWKHDLDAILFARLRAFAAGKGEPGPDDLSQVVVLHASLAALLKGVQDAYELTTRARAALEACPAGQSATTPHIVTRQ
jgi:hypothetical protein